MYDGKQVLRFVNNYKTKDLYLIGNEMNKRIGTGNYDSDRTKFNIHYKDINKSNLYQEVKSILENRNIEYSHKTKTNILNGVTFTSDPEFFMTLGLPFKESDRVYQSGDKKGQNILVPNIKSKDDIPYEVTKYFDCCMKFLEDLVGKENIVMAQVHYDEDTPHLQAYFLPIVNEVQRKCYKRDSNGNLIKEDGKTILLRDKNNKIIYESIKGNFLNNDQFWKDLGGRNSFANIQDKFNKYITDCGFKLDRGNIGSNKVHQTKLEYKINELKTEMNNLYKDIENYNIELNKSKEILENNIKNDNLNIKKNIIGYSSKDVEKLIDYSTDLERLNNINKNKLDSNENTINRLSIENNFYKNNKELIDSKKYIYKQNIELKNKDDEIDYWKNAFKKVSNALDIKLNRKPMKYVSDYISLADSIKAANKLKKEAEEAADEFHKLFEL
ncbi:MAG TPA: plasmid recombination protein [Candidatus Pelethosoma merdigallinarum]|nr:plasmid recombination protein [Candidatus Pelethosoma merdigallinarum]